MTSLTRTGYILVGHRLKRAAQSDLSAGGSKYLASRHLRDAGEFALTEDGFTLTPEGTIPAGMVIVLEGSIPPAAKARCRLNRSSSIAMK